jgi:hypothetical protein
VYTSPNIGHIDSPSEDQAISCTLPQILALYILGLMTMAPLASGSS